jgi:preprotein translocase subunit SecD
MGLAGVAWGWIGVGGVAERRIHRVLEAVLNGMVASLFPLVALTVVGDWQMRGFLMVYSLGIVCLILVVAIVAGMMGRRILTQLGYAALGFLMVWGVAFVF